MSPLPVAMLEALALVTFDHDNTSFSTPPTIQRFEQIRAQWEIAQPASDKMVGRKEKSALHTPLNEESNSGTGSKFRRKLSHGLSFISNPLSQRKNTPGRLPLDRTSASFHSNAPTTGPSESEALLSPMHYYSPLDHTHTAPSDCAPSNNDKVEQSNDPDATPRPLPRSNTMSFIPRPRPAGRDSGLSVANAEPSSKSYTPVVAVDSDIRVTPSKIPSPSPPQDRNRCASSRQYKRTYTAQQEKFIGAGAAFAGTRAQSPSKASVRSYTTPNFVKNMNPSQPHFMLPRKPRTQKTSGSPAIRPSMKENTPMARRDGRRISQSQEKGLRREKLVTQTTAANRRSLGPGSSLGQGSHPVRNTSPRPTKRLSSNLPARTPLTAKKVSIIAPSNFAYRSNGGSIAQPRLMGPVDPPILPLADANGIRPVLPRSSTDRHFRRMTLGTTDGVDGVETSSQSLVGKNSEVRLPRSSTFHHMPRLHETPPPIPCIPERYKRPLPIQDVITPQQRSSNLWPRHLFVPKSVSSFLIPEESTGNEHTRTQVCSPFATISGDKNSATSSVEEPSDDEVAEMLPTTLPTTSYTFFKALRPFSIIEEGVPYADGGATNKVKEYMPPLWWAGRFQTRFDQWRNDAMRAELDPNYKPEGLLGQCKLSQDRTAACYIFLQLRDLCGSNRAADSLWEFEYKYRQAHKLIGAGFDLQPLTSRGQEEVATPKQGPIGRAVRKLTPRKSSLVNLLKGKGWNRVEEIRPIQDGSSEQERIIGAAQHRSSESS